MSSLRGDSTYLRKHSTYSISEQTRTVVSSMRERTKHQETKSYSTTSSSSTTASSASTASTTTSPATATETTSASSTSTTSPATTTKKEEQFDLEGDAEYAEYDAAGTRDENADYSDGNVDYNPDSTYFSK